MSAAERHSLNDDKTKTPRHDFPKPLHVLLVDDDQINRIVAGELLRQQGWQVTEAENGQLALAAIAATGFDLVLMDLEMPGMDGLEATRRIRDKEDATTPRLPIIAMTAHAQESYRQQCLAAGMDDYVSKPFMLDNLLQVIFRHLPGPATTIPAESQGQPPSPAELPA